MPGAIKRRNSDIFRGESFAFARLFLFRIKFYAFNEERSDNIGWISYDS